MKFYADSGRLMFEDINLAYYEGYQQADAADLAQFFNWMHELYTRDKQGTLLPRPESRGTYSCDSMDGRCG